MGPGILNALFFVFSRARPGQPACWQLAVNRRQLLISSRQLTPVGQPSWCGVEGRSDVYNSPAPLPPPLCSGPQALLSRNPIFFPHVTILLGNVSTCSKNFLFFLAHTSLLCPIPWMDPADVESGLFLLSAFCAIHLSYTGLCSARPCLRPFPQVQHRMQRRRHRLPPTATRLCPTQRSPLRPTCVTQRFLWSCGPLASRFLCVMC